MSAMVRSSAPIAAPVMTISLNPPGVAEKYAVGGSRPTTRWK